MVGTVLSLLYDEMVRIWCYRWTAIITAVVLFLAGAVFVMRMPDNYDAWAQIYVPRQTAISENARITPSPRSRNISSRVAEGTKARTAEWIS